MPTSEVRDPCISRPIHPAGESAVWRVGRSPFKGEDRNREPLTAGSSFPVSILSFPLLTIPIARTPAQATMLSPAESIAALLICLLALFPLPSAILKTAVRGLLCKRSHHVLFQFRILYCHSQKRSGSSHWSAKPLFSLHPCLYPLSVAHSTPATRASLPCLKHTPASGHWHLSLPLSRRLCPQTDEWLTLFHCKFLSNVTFSVMPAPIIRFKIAAPSSPSPTELPALLFSP